ncbi:hypothetical protein FD755_014764 [Muntiacus reevesi]|uniref:Glutaredoxin domain-containing protein n=1 Tax=Muntiacus reevesi TaxID=9886 RepID=A0A5N3XKW7_MUNRE|nr:hypothetical protein FD755_014764 [Muntiacus reevesi]
MYWSLAPLVGTWLVRVRSSSAGRLEGPVGISGSGMGNSTSSSLGNAATAPVNQIQETISNNRVVIFSKTSCSYYALHKMTGERTVPRIFVNGTFIGGATDTRGFTKKGNCFH